MLDFLKNIGPTELIIIGVILVVFFGSKKIAELGRAGGETVKEVKKIKKELGSAVEEIKKEPVEEAESRKEVSK
jgi:sec-independent protein translocase protein TatA